jgi:hypothetical protein
MARESRGKSGDVQLIEEKSSSSRLETHRWVGNLSPGNYEPGSFTWLYREYRGKRSGEVLLIER